MAHVIHPEPAAVGRIDERAVRAIEAERDRIGDLIEENAETFASFAADKVAAVKLVALLVRSA